jgi:hypothetical protein
MQIQLSPELEAALQEAARRRGVSAEVLVVDALQDRFLTRPLEAPRDKWERRLRRVATDCGVSLPDSAVSSEGIYE